MPTADIAPGAVGVALWGLHIGFSKDCSLPLLLTRLRRSCAASYGEAVTLPAGLPDWRRHLLTDPQTSGGLLVSCAPERAEATVQSINSAGYSAVRIISRAEPGPPCVKVEVG